VGTTALFAELVVGGVLTLTWMALFVITALGPSRLTPPFESSSVTAGLLLAVAYALGVVFDRVWDFLLDVSGVQKWLRGRKSDVVLDSKLDRQRRQVFGADPKMAMEFVNYHRSRMRIARASIFNFSLITASGMTLLAVRYGGVQTPEFAMAGAAGCVICSASALALLKLGRSHDRVLGIVAPAEEKIASSTVPVDPEDSSE